MDTSEHSYDEKQVSLILKRAIELQAQDRNAGDTRLSYRDLEKVAQEAGIDPVCLQQAAREVEQGHLGRNMGFGRDRGFSRAFFGGPVEVTLEESVEAELPSAGIEELLPLVQDATGETGEAKMVGNTLSFQVRNQQNARDLQVLVSRRQERVQIRAKERNGNLAAALFGGLMGGIGGGFGFGFGLGFGLGFLHSALFAVCWPLGAIALGYFLARTIFGFVTKRREKKLRDLVKTLVAGLRPQKKK